LPAEGVRQAGLLVDAELVALAEIDRLAESILEQRRQPLLRNLALAALIERGGVALRQVLRQRLREFVHLLAGSRSEQSHVVHLFFLPKMFRSIPSPGRGCTASGRVSVDLDSTRMS